MGNGAVRRASTGSKPAEAKKAPQTSVAPTVHHSSSAPEFKAPAGYALGIGTVAENPPEEVKKKGKWHPLFKDPTFGGTMTEKTGQNPYIGGTRRLSCDSASTGGLEPWQGVQAAQAGPPGQPTPYPDNQAPVKLPAFGHLSPAPSTRDSDGQQGPEAIQPPKPAPVDDDASSGFSDVSARKNSKPADQAAVAVVSGAAPVVQAAPASEAGSEGGLSDVSANKVGADGQGGTCVQVCSGVAPEPVQRPPSAGSSGGFSDVSKGHKGANAASDAVVVVSGTAPIVPPQAPSPEGSVAGDGPQPIAPPGPGAVADPDPGSG